MASPIIKKIGGAAASLLILFGLFLCAAYIYYALVEVHLSHYSIRLARNDPAALFFKDVDNPRLRTDIIDRSNSLDSLFALGGSNLDLYQLNKVAPRLIVFVDNTSADAFLTTTTDILRRADHNTSLLAINLATKEVSLNLS